MATLGLQILLTVACALALTQNDLLRDQASMYQSLAAPPVGRSVPAIRGVDWAGDKRVFDYQTEARPTLIYVFSKDCSACVANWDLMRRLQQLSPGRLRIAYVDTVDALTNDYLREHAMEPGAVFSRLEPESELHYGARATPQSQLVARNGLVLWSKLGKFDQTDIATLEALIAEQERKSSLSKGAEQ